MPEPGAAVYAVLTGWYATGPRVERRTVVSASGGLVYLNCPLRPAGEPVRAECVFREWPDAVAAYRAALRRERDKLRRRLRVIARLLAAEPKCREGRGGDV